jgi:hypothetical protein|tara:strand:- start:18 stop:248 length:231 start_codon:yes stop_codon:yes gene_type:complete
MVEIMDISGYSSHDWRKHTHDAVVVSSDSSMQTSMEVNKSKVIFTNPNTLKKQEVDLSRLIRVFCNNAVGHKKSIK